MGRVDVPALSFLILCGVFVAYEIAGGSSRFPDLHTISFYAQQHTWLKWLLYIAPPALYQGWWLWHMSGIIVK